VVAISSTSLWRPARHFLLAVIWLAGAGGAGAFADGYIAPSSSPPGGLSPEDTPQIMLLTFDDLVDSNRYGLLQQVLTNHWNPNGSTLQATFFMNTDWTDYWLVQQLHAQGHELAVHTMTHTTGTNTDLAGWRAEIVGCRKTLSDLAAIPLEEIRGFRAPYLGYSDASFQILGEQGFAYDTSMIETPGSLSANGRSYIWPYTLDHGVLQDCWTGICPTNVFPGLFEVPMWDLLNAGGGFYSTMDPEGTYDEITGVLRTNFTNRYDGYRAPMGVFLHSDWLASATHRAALNDFIDWSLARSNVWWVSAGDLVEFMRAPQTAAAAHAFPPFVTRTNALPSTSLVSRCVYEPGVVRTTAPCPEVWPRPDTVYAETVPRPGGSMTMFFISLNEASYWARIVVSNSTESEAIDWEASFRIAGGRVTVASDCLFQTNGDAVAVHPAGWMRPLAPGEVEMVEIGGPRTGAVTFTERALTLLGLGPRRPLVTDLRPGDGGATVVAWDDSAYGYDVERAGDAAAGDWATVATVHGVTTWTNGDPGLSGFYRVKPVP